MKKTREEIKKEYDKVCSEYLDKLFEDWGVYGEVKKAGWWVADDIGGVFCLEDDIFINMDDIRYCVDNNVDYQTYQDYLDYNCKCAEFNLSFMNLKSFINGSPRISEESFNHLKEAKEYFENAIEEVKNKY